MGQEVTEQNALSRELHKSASTMLTHARRVYSKDFLLSVAELEDCKRLPAGLDSALLRETETKSNDKGVAIPGASSRGLIRTTRENDAHSESPPDVPEWRRPSSLPGSPFLKGPRQAEPNVSSPRPGLARGGNTARSIMGRSGSARWELRPGGADRDRDPNRTQYEWESTPTESGGRLHGRGLARSALVVSQEHDGLLGSGGPIVHRGMIQTPTPDRHRAERASRAGRTGEQYHSARGGKVSRVSQYTRREDADSISDETFGSDDLPNGERSEQERQRRDSFEQMRKELRMKPLNTARNYNDNWFGECVQGTETFLSSSPGTPQSTTSSKDDILKPHNKAASSTPRLLVPPGFSKPTIPKTGSPKENNEASKSPLSHVKDEDMHVLKQTSSNDGVKLDKGEHLSSLSLKIDQLEDKDQKTSSPLQSPVMSKFARWFPSQGSSIKESEWNIDKQEPILLVTKSEDLPPSLGISKTPAELAGGSEDAVLSKLSSVTSLMPINKKGSVLPMPAGPSLEDIEKVMTAGADFTGVVRSNEDRVSDRKNCVMLEDHLLSDGDHAIMRDAPSAKDVSEKKTPPVFLTCEDLEQSLLAETAHSGNHSKLKEVQQDTDKNINLMQLLQIGSNNRARSQQSRAAEQDTGKVMDGSASLHIMSLLQKKSGDATTALPLADSTSPVSAEASAYLTGHDHRVADARRKESQSSTAEIISLETLFGKGFVNELRSVGEPVSSKLVVDDSIHNGKEKSLLDVVLPSRQSAKSSGHAEVAFIEEAGWDYDRHLKEPKDAETMQGSDSQNEFWSDMSPHGHTHTKTSKNILSSRGHSINGAVSGDFRQPKSSPHLPHQGNFSHGQYHEGYHPPTSEVPSHRMPFEPVQEPPFIHDSALYGMSMYGPNSPFHPFQEGFIRANHVPGHFDERSSVVGGAYRMPSAFPSDYPESVQMGFNPNPGMSDPRIGGSRIYPPADRWFTGDHMQASQGLSGFNPYQHQVPSMIQERKAGYGASAKNHNVGLPSDKRLHSETTQLPYAPGLDPYMFSGSRPDYG